MVMTKYDNSGIISKNKYKKLDSHPDITGEATISGVKLRVAGWHKMGSKGPFYALQFKTEEEKTSQTSQSSHRENIDDEILF
jgi:hypothetical protein